MAIRNNRIGGNDFIENESVYPKDINDTFNRLYTKQMLGIQALNNIRQVCEGVTKISYGENDGFAEAYGSGAGTRSSVSTGKTTATFSTNKYIATFNNHGYISDTFVPFSNPLNIFDGNDATYASYSGTEAQTGVGEYWTLDTYVTSIKIKASTSFLGSGNCNDRTIWLETYNGSTWTRHTALATVYEQNSSDPALEYDDTFELNETTRGIRIIFSVSQSAGANYSAQVYTMERSITTDIIISQEIPTGIFESNVNKSFGQPLIEDWEEGANVEYKLVSSTASTDWLSYNTNNDVTEFIDPPTEVIIKLTPKDSSPTPGYPSIRGFYIYQNDYN